LPVSAGFELRNETERSSERSGAEVERGCAAEWSEAA